MQVGRAQKIHVHVPYAFYGDLSAMDQMVPPGNGRKIGMADGGYAHDVLKKQGCPIPSELTEKTHRKGEPYLLYWR